MSSSIKFLQILQRKNKFLLVYLLLCAPFLVAYLFATRGQTIMPKALALSTVEIKVYSLCIIAAIAYVAWLAGERAKSYKELGAIKVDELLLAVVIPGLVGARMFYVLEFWSYYQQVPQEILAVWNGGLSIFGALAGGLIALIVYTRLNNINTLMLADLIIMHLPLAQILGRYGNFANQEHFGPEASLPWAIFIDATGKYHHPAFLYEQLGNLVLYILLFTVYKRNNLQTKGLLTAIYLVGYGCVRFLIDIFRTDDRVAIGLTVAQIIAVGFVFFGFGFILFANRKKWRTR